MLVLSKHPTEWKSYPMMKDVFDKIVDNKTLIVDTLWSTFAEHKDNIDRWLAKEHHKVIVMNWWDEFRDYQSYVDAYQSNDRVLVLDHMASWLDICDKKFIEYKWEDVQPQSFDNVFLCYQGKWKHFREHLYKAIHNWEVPGQITLAGSHSLKDNIPVHEGDQSIYNPDPSDPNHYPNDIYSLGDLNVWNSHFLNIVTETLEGASYPTWITEKTLKPIIGARPFIIYGDPAIYTVLEKFGFETFLDDIEWPEVNYKDPDVVPWHWQMENIKIGLKELQQKNLQVLYKKCLPKIKHNFYNWRDISKKQHQLLMTQVSEFVN